MRQIVVNSAIILTWTMLEYSICIDVSKIWTDRSKDPHLWVFFVINL
jgi:hypothetical protein